MTKEDEIKAKKEELFKHYLNHLNKQKGENKMEKVKNALPVMKVNHEARANLVNAMAYDEKVRRESYERSKQYVGENALKESRMPEWMYYLMFAIIGMLLVISVDASIINWF